ncbi:hypothetical protein RIF29_27077 [Crotalaria pallida]|uniref:Uncharacterized protein n=1 Tax=Crotalaria pallida TaxID=3830 RepID=A0AAN9EQM4_CROPI
MFWIGQSQWDPTQSRDPIPVWHGAEMGFAISSQVSIPAIPAPNPSYPRSKIPVSQWDLAGKGTTGLKPDFELIFKTTCSFVWDLWVILTNP